MNARLFFETIIPLLVMAVTCLIAISTPLNEFNFFSKILVLVDEHGEPFFDVIHIGLVCDDCLKLDSYIEQLRCEHKRDVHPPWHSAARADRFKKLFTDTGNASLGLRENAGVVANDFQTVFSRKQFDGLLNNPRPPFLIDIREFRMEVPVIFITCDPDADGPSEMAIVSGFINRGYTHSLPTNAYVLLGFEIKSCPRPRDQDELIQQHILRLRQNIMFAHSKIIFIPENMTGKTHTQLEDAVGHFYNVFTLHQNGGLKAGITKNDYITKSYVIAANSALDAGLVYLYKDWITVSAHMVFTSVPDTRAAILKRFFEQLCRFAYDEHMRLHGKHNDEQDDGAVAFLMFIYWTMVVVSSTTVPYYQNLIKH